MKKPEGVRFRENLKNRHIYSGMGFPGGSHSERPTCNAGDMCSVPGLGRSPGERNGNPLQCSCLENFMDRGDWRATAHGIAESWTRLSH